MPDTGKQSTHIKTALQKQLIAVGIGLLIWAYYLLSGAAGTQTVAGYSWIAALLLFIYAFFAPMIEAGKNDAE